MFTSKTNLNIQNLKIDYTKKYQGLKLAEIFLKIF